MMKTKLVFLAFFTFFLTFCGMNQAVSMIYSFQPKINFLYLRMFFDANTNDNKITLTRRISKNKSNRIDLKDEYVGSDYLIIEFYEDNVLTKTVNVEHPLIKSVEVFDGTQFQRGNNQITNANFFLRIPSKKVLNKVIIYEKRANQPRVEKITINL
jgi:hypothetical protein